MAEEKKNPLIGAFRSLPPKEAAKAPTDAKAAEPAKPPEADKPIPAAQKPAEPVKPVIPPKAEEIKAAPKPNGTATPVKPTEEKPAAKPSVPAKAEDICMLTATTAYATGGDPLTIVNNLSDFIFSVIKAIGIIILGWGIVQVGMSIQSHDASQRTQGLLCLFGGLLIAFAKEILTLIGAV